MVKKKKSNPARTIFHLFLLAGIFGLLISSYLSPWVVGKVILIKKTMYIYDLERFDIILALVGGFAFVLTVYSIISHKLFYPGLIQVIMGGVVAFLSRYTVGRIEEKDLAFLGIGPLKIVDARPDIGLFLFALAGIGLILTGLIYLIEALLTKE